MLLHSKDSETPKVKNEEIEVEEFHSGQIDSEKDSEGRRTLNENLCGVINKACDTKSVEQQEMEDTVDTAESDGTMTDERTTKSYLLESHL